jgi:hypothetical protein
MTFYDYDLSVTSTGSETHRLRADNKPLPHGAFCTIRPATGVEYLDGNFFPVGYWVRKTRWAGKGGTRYIGYKTLNEALNAGIAWARRREAEDRRESAKAQHARASHEAHMLRVRALRGY